MPDTQLPQPQPFGELFDAAARKNFIALAQQNTTDLMTYGDPVEGYKPKYEEVDVLSKTFGLTEGQRTELSGALSPEELQYRAQRYQASNTDRQSLKDAGWKGVAAEVLAYAADPLLLPAYLIKTPMFVGAALERVGVTMAKTAVTGALERAVGAGAIGGATGLGQEGVLSLYDVNRDVNDVIIAGLSGVVGGMAFSSLADGGAAIFNKVTAKSQLGRAMNEAVERIDWDNNMALINDADNVITGASMGRVETTAYGKYFDNLESTIPDPIARKRVLTEGDALNKLIDDLVPVADTRLSRGVRQGLESEVNASTFAATRASQRISEILNVPLAGSGKVLARARQVQSRELAELREIVNKNTENVTGLRAQIEPSVSGEPYRAVAEINQLRRGVIPERLKDRYLDMITPEDAAPAYKEAISNVPKRQEPVTTPEQAAENVVALKEADELAAKEAVADTSIGAAEVKGAVLLRDDEGIVITDTYEDVFKTLGEIGERIPVVRSAGSTSIYTRVMSKMKDNNLRGLGALVFNDPHGIKGAPQSAIAFADTLRQRIMPTRFFTEDAARVEHLKSLGLNPLTQAGKYNEASISFDRDIALRIRELTTDVIAQGDDPVTRAAKSRAQSYRMSLEAMKRYGVRGFDDVDVNASYLPITYGRNDFTTALDKYGEDTVKEVLVRGYMNGKIPLSSKSAMMVADNTLERYYRKTGKVSEAKPSQSISGRVAELVNELKANKVPDTEISVVIRMLQDKSLDEAVSSRAMQSLHPDITATSLGTNLRLVDLINASTDGVHGYVKEASAQAAYARHGLRSRRQVEDTITEAFKRHRQELTTLTSEVDNAKRFLTPEGRESYPADLIAHNEKIVRDYERLGDIGKYRKFLDNYERDYFNGVRVSFGEAIEEASTMNAIASGSGKAVNLMLLGFSGVAQVADLGNVVGRAGIGAVLRNLPISTAHGVRSVLPSQKFFINNNQLTDISEIMGTVSHQDYLFGHKMMNGADYGDAVIGHVSAADRVLDNVSWLSGSMSMLRPIQGFIDELSSRSLLTNIVKLSRDGMFTGKTRKQLLEIGKISDESLDNSLAHIKAQMDSGDDIFAAVRTLDPKLRDELGTAIRQVHSSNISRSFYGELPAFTNTSMGKIFMKLQSFALVAYEKAIQRGLRHDKAA